MWWYMRNPDGPKQNLNALPSSRVVFTPTLEARWSCNSHKHKFVNKTKFLHTKNKYDIWCNKLHQNIRIRIKNL